LDDLQKEVQKQLDQTKEEVAHRPQVAGVVLKAVHSLSSQDMRKMDIYYRATLTMDVESCGQKFKIGNP
jgi:hypothetical protein